MPNNIEGKIYDLNNPYLTRDEKIIVESWFQLPGNAMEYVFWIILILHISYDISFAYVIIVPIIFNIILGLINWYFHKTSITTVLGLSLFHPFVTGTVGVGVGVYLFLHHAPLLAIISAIVGILGFTIFEFHIFLYTFLAHKYHMHPKYVFAKKQFGYIFPFEV